MDDSDDKIRRNLVIFSLLVIYFAIFDVSLRTNEIILFEKSISIKLPPIHVMWLAALLVIEYFSARLLQSDEFTKKWTETKHNFEEFYLGRIANRLKKELSKGVIKSFTDTDECQNQSSTSRNINEIAELLGKSKDTTLEYAVSFPDGHVEPQHIHRSRFSVRYTSIIASVNRLSTHSTHEAKEDVKRLFQVNDATPSQILSDKKTNNQYRKYTFGYQRYLLATLKQKDRVITNTLACYDVIARTHFGTTYTIPFLLALTALICAFTKVIITSLSYH